MLINSFWFFNDFEREYIFNKKNKSDVGFFEWYLYLCFLVIFCL